jgi:hypothetical protein
MFLTKNSKIFPLVLPERFQISKQHLFVALSPTSSPLHPRWTTWGIKKFFLILSIL